MDIRDILKQEVLRRQKSRANQFNTAENLLQDNEAIIDQPVEDRQDITPLVKFIDDQYGGNLASTVKRPETVQESLRKALNARIQAPKEDPLAAINALNTMDNNEVRNAMLTARAEKPKALSGTQLERLDNVRMAAGALSDLEGALNKGVSARPDLVAGIFGDNEFSESATRFSEAIGRMQSGGAITKDEEGRFLRLIPKFNDSDEIRKQKIANMRQILEGRFKNLSQGPDTTTPLFNQAPQATQAPSDGSVDFAQLSDEQLKKIIGGK